MNLKNYLIGAGISALILAGSASKGGEQIKVSVVHYSLGETVVMDTIFDAESGYTAEQYLKDNGLDPKHTQIINADEFDGKHLLRNNNSVLFMRKQNKFEFNPDDDATVKTIRTISVTSDGDAEKEIIIEEVVNGDYDGDYDGDESIEAMVEKLENHDENVFLFNNFAEENHIKIENINGEMTIELNGEALRLKELLQKEKLTNDQIQLIKLYAKDGNDREEVIYELNSDEENKEKIIVITKEHTEKEMRNLEETMGEMITLEIEEIMHEFEHTIAIVSTVSTNNGSGESFMAEPVQLPIEGPKYYPNPSEGKFRLEFFLPERGQTQIQIFDISGRMVFDKNLGNFQGEHNDNIDISNLESGHYIMHITQNNLRLAEKIIVN